MFGLIIKNKNRNLLRFKSNYDVIQHLIITDKNRYYLMQSSIDDDVYLVSLNYQGKSKIIGKEQMIDNNFGRLGGESFTTCILSGIDIIKSEIKKNKEIIVFDKKVS